MTLGTSCLATIMLSLRDESHSPIEAPYNYLSAYGVYLGSTGLRATYETRFQFWAKFSRKAKLAPHA